MRINLPHYSKPSCCLRESYPSFLLLAVNSLSSLSVYFHGRTTPAMLDRDDVPVTIFKVMTPKPAEMHFRKRLLPGTKGQSLVAHWWRDRWLLAFLSAHL